MPRLGAHMSVAGGLPRAVERAVLHRCGALQIFAKNANQWRGRTLAPEEIREFRARVRAVGIGPVVSHASYLINLATTNPVLRLQSLEAMGDELDRAEALGLLGVVLHPGCYTLGSEAEGLQLIANGLRDLLLARRRGRTMILLEQTAGQGTALGGLKVFHMNDSKTPRGSRVDRHEHIGEGCLGLEPFRRIVNDRRFQDLPMLLETPKEEGRAKGAIEIDRHDERNLNTLRGLLRVEKAGEAGGAGKAGR